MHLLAALLAFQATASPGPLLAKGLTADDLGLSGAEFSRRVRSVLGDAWGIGRDQDLRRIGRDTLLVGLRSKGYSTVCILLWRKGSSVDALDLTPKDEFAQASPGPLANLGGRMVGGIYTMHGNGSFGDLLVLNHVHGGWKVVRRQEPKDEVTNLSLSLDGNPRLTVTTRSYDFKALSQPHAGPLLHHITVWTLKQGRWAPGKERKVESALAAFDRFCAAAMHHNGQELRSLCPDDSLRPRAIGEILKVARKGELTANCPNSVEEDEGTVFSLGSGDTQSGFFELARRKGRWVIVRMR